MRSSQHILHRYGVCPDDDVCTEWATAHNHQIDSTEIMRVRKLDWVKYASFSCRSNWLQVDDRAHYLQRIDIIEVNVISYENK